MTPDKLNAELINAMREKIPDGANLANLLMDILSIGKEAIYRRFRGEVPFTLAEAMIISQKLDVSLDQLNGITCGGDRVMDLNLFQDKKPEVAYLHALEHYVTLLKGVTRHDENILVDTSNRISHLYACTSPTLSRFNLFKWIYQQDAITPGSTIRSYEEIEIPSGQLINEKELTEVLTGFPTNCYIWDSMVFKSIITDIEYFKEIHLISPESLQKLKEDLLALIDKLEGLATTGYHANGSKVEIFISHTNLGTAYSYIDAVDQQLCFIKLQEMNVITSHNEILFENMKRWAGSMKRFSILISQSADIYRYKFFRQQREYVNKL